MTISAEDEALLPVMADLVGYAAADLEAILLLAFDDCS